MSDYEKLQLMDPTLKTEADYAKEALWYYADKLRGLIGSAETDAFIVKLVNAGIWTCASCSTRNDLHKKECYICQKSRPMKTPRPIVPVNLPGRFA